MMDRMKAGQWHTPVVPPGQLKKPQIPAERPAAVGQKSFQDILQTKFISFSHHAEVRMQQRGIQMNADRLTQLETAVAKAEAKGAKESLVIFQDVAMIVNVKNRTVVTAMDAAQMKDNVFTQIDSAVIIPS